MASLSVPPPYPIHTSVCSKQLADSNCWLLVAVSQPLSSGFVALLLRLVKHFYENLLRGYMAHANYELICGTILRCWHSGVSAPLVAYFCVMLEFDEGLRTLCAQQMRDAGENTDRVQIMHDYAIEETMWLRSEAHTPTNMATREWNTRSIFDSYELALRGTLLQRDYSMMQYRLECRSAQRKDLTEKAKKPKKRGTRTRRILRTKEISIDDAVALLGVGADGSVADDNASDLGDAMSSLDLQSSDNESGGLFYSSDSESGSLHSSYGSSNSIGSDSDDSVLVVEYDYEEEDETIDAGTILREVPGLAGLVEF